MGYARHIGRVGALAVTLGVGAAIANAPGVAYADSTTTSTHNDNSTTENKQENPSTTNDATTVDAKDSGSSAADRRQQRRAVLRSVADSIQQTVKAIESAVNGNGLGARTPTSGAATSNLGTSNSSRRVSAEGNLASAASTRLRARTTDLGDAAAKVDEAATNFTQRVEQAVQKYTAPTASVAPNAAQAAPQAVTTAAVTSSLFPPRARSSVVPLFTNALGSVLQPVIYGDGIPALPTLPSLMVVLGAVRDEIERTLGARPPQPNYPPTDTQPIGDPNLPDQEDQHVLVIAIDGTNMSKVLEDPVENDNFIELMSNSTVSTPSIVGHTTVSNPSWTAILTGAWDNKTGVINNVYTPWTYDRWPSVFTQLETANPAIRTKSISDWDVIAAITDSGVGADEVVYIAQQPDDPTWEKTDRAVTEETIDSLATNAEAPNFMVTYLVQVDEAGHHYGGDSEEYADAIARTDENLGDILDAVAEREKPCVGGNTTGCGEKWTIIVVTDHGHQPQPGFGHGFQSPRETDTFVIVNGPQFDTPGCDPAGDGCARFNPDYEIVDVTPTVRALFKLQQDPRSDGVPLQSLSDSTSVLLTQAELEDALEQQMASNDYPNLIVNVALSTRTIVAFIPYFVNGAGLPTPIGEILYVVTNTPAQVVALATGVWGARLFQILPPPPIVITPDGPNSTLAAFRTDCGSVTLDPAGCVAV